jgi:dipeptidyl aminopeptidase/acylaminoacyl peptidase
MDTNAFVRVARGRVAVLGSVLAASLGAAGPVAAQTAYRLPPKEIVDILDAPPLPSVSVSPDRQWLLLMEQASMPGIAEFAEPMLRIAGARINPATTGPARAQRFTGLVLKKVADGSERRIEVPANSALGDVRWSPDGRRIAFTRTLDDGIELMVAEAASGQVRRVGNFRLNATSGAPCQWLGDGARLLCRLVPAGRGAPPEEPRVPTGPTIQETKGRAAPVRTYQDLLEDEHDERLFDYYFTAQLAVVDATTGAATPVGAPAIFDRVDPSPDGRYLLISRTVRPYSYLVPESSFPKEIEVWTLQGEKVREIAKLPLAENVPIRGVRPGPRSIAWRPLQPATLVWAEALDGGDPANKVRHRDRVVALAAPFQGEPVELARLEDRFAGIVFGEKGVALLNEVIRERRWNRTWILDVDRPGTAPRLLWDRSAEDRYGDPGRPLLRTTDAGNAALLQRGDWIYLSGAGASPEGERPFLDRLNLKTLKTERLWRSSADAYESVVALLDDQGRRLLTRRESAKEPPNYFVRDARGGQPRALTAFKDPAPQLTGIQKQVVVYERADGIPLSGTLYLPPDYRPGTRLPVVVWAYPREFVSADAAGQVAATDNRFTFFRGASHLFFLTQGYAVFDGPSMPIIGGDTANNTYIEQLVMSAEAAVRKIVDMGIADPDRIGVGGHSYGAFMTANLLAHTDLFRAGIARSGAYNRTLTPFGFQNEQRIYWEAPEVYNRMSPFMNADKIDEPMLMIHGEADNNSGTFPIQSERMYHALKGLGGTARLVMLPHESHGYAARESVLHTLAEMIDWFDRYVKNAPPRTPRSTTDR